MNLAHYRTLVFDCDGVVLDSNRVKTEAFRVAASPWGVAAAESLVSYHTANGGISRYAKFEHFLKYILPYYAVGHTLEGDGPQLQAMLSAYAEQVRTGLMSCAVTEGLEALRVATPNARWLVVSGGDQTELREVFAARGLAEYFDGGIFGSPTSKYEHIAREIANKVVVQPALCLGDSKLDHQVAKTLDLDFIFVHGWTDMSDWWEYTERHAIVSINGVNELVQTHNLNAR